MPLPAFAIPLILSGISALAGGLSNRKSTQQQQSTTNFSGTDVSDYSSTSTPTYDPKALSFRDILINNVLKGMNVIPSEEDILFGNIDSVNNARRLQKILTESNLASRGLSYSPAAGTAIGNVENQRISDIIGAHREAPLQYQQYRQQAMAPALSLFSQIPYGTTQKGTSTTSRSGTQQTSGTTTQPGNVLGGIFGNLGPTIAGLYGMGAFNPYLAPSQQMNRGGSPGAAIARPTTNPNVIDYSHMFGGS